MDSVSPVQVASQGITSTTRQKKRRKRPAQPAISPEALRPYLASMVNEEDMFAHEYLRPWIEGDFEIKSPAKVFEAVQMLSKARSLAWEAANLLEATTDR